MLISTLFAIVLELSKHALDDHICLQLESKIADTLGYLRLAITTINTGKPKESRWHHAATNATKHDLPQRCQHSLQLGVEDINEQQFMTVTPMSRILPVHCEMHGATPGGQGRAVVALSEGKAWVQ